MRIFLIGFMGSGKTHWGRLLSQKLGIPFFDLDEQIVAYEGKSINEIFETKGEEYFRLVEKDILHIITESHESQVMACGGGAPCYFNNIDYMHKSGITVWLNTSLDVLMARLIKGKDHRPLLKDLSEEQLKAYIGKKFADRRIYYGQADIIVNEDSVTLDELIEKIFHA